MSQWRRVAVGTLVGMEDAVRRSVGIYDFWGNINSWLAVSFDNDPPEKFEAKLTAAASYINWYGPLYADNPDMFTAFCYAFAEHVVDDGFYKQLLGRVHEPALGWLRSYEPQYRQAAR